MHTVALNIPGRLGTRTYRRDLPASWSEVPEARRLPLLQCLLQNQDITGQVRALRIALNLPNRVFNSLTEDHLYDLLQHCQSWMIIKPDPQPRITQFEHNSKTYHLPSAHGINLVALEYPLADEAFMKFVKGDVASLITLCSVLCREAEPDPVKIRTRGDKREPLLSRSEAEYRAKDLEGLAPDVAMSVLFYFAGVKEFVHGAYGKVLFEPDDLEEEAPPAGNSLGWWGLYFQTAVDGPFGRDVDLLYQKPFHDVCVFLVDRIRQRKELEAQQRLQSANFGIENPES